jgi:hypothetical protein
MQRIKFIAPLFLLAIFLGSSCSTEKNAPDNPLFLLKNPEETGIRFENRLQSTDSSNILEYLYFYNGGGVAAGDLDNDGLIDLYFTGNQVPNKLYHNKGKLKFEDITETAGVTGDGGWSTGVTMADVNGDGLLDIYVCQVSEQGKSKGKNKLYLNQGKLQFTEVAADYGIDFAGYSTHAAFFDYDRDGDLDLYLLNHNVKSPEVFAKSENRDKPDPSGDKLYKNLLAEGKTGFEEVTQAAGIYSSILGFGLGVSVEDFNADGWLDLYVSNDFTENDYLYLNQQNGTYREALAEMMPSTSRYSMGNDAADLTGDGLPELFTTDMLPQDPEIWMKSVGEDKAEVYQIKKQFGYQDQYVRNHLQVNLGGGKFAEVAQFAGVHASDWSWSPLIFDMDNDGLADIHVSNGIVKRPNDLDFIQYSQEADASLPLVELRKKQIDLLPQLKIANFAWKNKGDLQFENQAFDLGLGQESYSNGSVYADLDQDGDLDLVLNNLDQESFLYENRSERLGHAYLSISLKQAGFNPQALGAQVQVYAQNKQWTQRISTSRGFQSGPAAQLVFGLGKITAIDSLLVTWPSGQREVFPAQKINQPLSLQQGTGKEAAAISSPQSPALTSPSLSWTHQEKDAVDELKREYLSPKSFARMGPAVAVGDVNGDGREDMYLGGALDQAGAIFTQNAQGGFDPVDNPMFEMLAKAEDIVAEFADFNGDGFLDLFVGSGGNEYESGSMYNFDRIFFGNGQGQFQFSMNSLPPIGENTSCVAIHDVDQDGDLDLFVGSSVRSGDYGASPKSSLLINQGNGQFKDETRKWFGEEVDFGMVNTATWADLDGDGKASLLLSGDWQGIRAFQPESGAGMKEVVLSGLEFAAGWINSLQAADVNGDGKLDLLVGNVGLNTKLKASKEKPVWLYHHDFDGNGQADPLIFHYMEEKLVPFGTRDDLIRQIPSLKKNHSSYTAYAKINGPEDLFPKAVLDKARKLPAYSFQSGVYFQDAKGGFEFVPFPAQAQWAPITSILVDPSNKQLWLGGNFSGFRADLGKSVNIPVLSYLWKNGTWVPMALETLVPGPVEVRSLQRIQVKGEQWVLGIKNGASPIWMR